MAFLGLKGTGDIPANTDYTGSWLDTILWRLPRSNRKICPLTALASRLPKKEFDTDEIHWKEEGTPTRRLTVVSDDGTSIVVNETNGALVTRADIVMREDETGKMFVVTADGNAQTITSTSRGVAGTSSANLTPGNHITVITSASPEGGVSPTGLSNQPTDNNQYLQKIRESFEITDEFRNSWVRQGDPLTNDQFRSLMRWGMDMEMAFYFGGMDKLSNTVNGKPRRLMAGLDNICQTNVFDLSTAPTSGLLTLSQLDTIYDQTWRYSSNSSDEKLWICGSTQYSAIYHLETARNSIRVDYSPNADTFGIKFEHIITPFGGNFWLFSHPVFNEHPYFRQYGFIIDMANVRYAYKKDRDLDLFEDILKDNNNDERKDEWKGTVAIQVAHESTHATIRNVSGAAS